VSAAFVHIRWRLVGWCVLVLGAILLTLGGLLDASLSRSLMDSVDGNLASSSQTAENELAESVQTGRPEREGYRGGLFYVVLDSSGTVVDNPQSVDLSPLGRPADLLGSPAPRFTTVDFAGDPVRIFIRPLEKPDLQALTLVVGQSLAPERAEETRLVLLLLLGGAVGLLLSFLGAWFLASRALVPIEQAFLRQQEFVADASHELRTPLTILRSATDLLDERSDEPLRANKDLFDGVRREIARMERLTQDLLTVARSDRGELQLALGQVDLGELARDLARRVDVLADKRDIRLEAYLDGASPVVEADPDRLHQIGLILLDNALNHTPPGGAVRIVVRTEHDGGVLEVEDHGEGIPAAQLSRVFDRFYRVDRARSRATGGSGLGLAIAETLVAAHGGRITLTPNPGGGVRATVWLPLAAALPSVAENVSAAPV